MSKKVAIIDDDKNNVKFLSALLSENGYEPIVAYDGREGLQVIKENDIDLIVLDVMMPKKTGFRSLQGTQDERRAQRHPDVDADRPSLRSLKELDEKKDDTFEAPLRQSPGVAEKGYRGDAGERRHQAGDVRRQADRSRLLHRESEGADRRLSGSGWL